MSGLTPARLAAERKATADRELVRELLTLCIGLFQKFDLFTVDTPVTDDLHNELVTVSQLLRSLNVGVAAMIAHVPVPESSQHHPSWPRLREDLLRTIRAARWLWANETQVHDRLTNGTWSPTDELSLIEARGRLEELAILFGYPRTTSLDKE